MEVWRKKGGVLTQGSVLQKARECADFKWVHKYPQCLWPRLNPSIYLTLRTLVNRFKFGSI